MIYFIGAGPGDPELITVKAVRVLQEAKVAIYAGSLVNPRVLDYLPPGATVYNSAEMTLVQVSAVFLDAWQNKQDVVRIHTGDPSVYGAIQEQMDFLRKHDIPYTVIPGVSSVFAAAAALEQELTLPGVSQTLILTRRAGRTPMPEGESLPSLAAHQATMAIFLSIHMIAEVVEELLTAYAPDTPVAVVAKASWPDAVVLRSTLSGIAQVVKEHAIDRTALILVGHVLDSDYQASKLYDQHFSHGFRQGTGG